MLTNCSPGFVTMRVPSIWIVPLRRHQGWIWGSSNSGAIPSSIESANYDTMAKISARAAQLHHTPGDCPERFHLAHGFFPQGLDEAMPEFLAEPLPDPWSGKPMRYRRTGNESYVLYSIGENRGRQRRDQQIQSRSRTRRLGLALRAALTAALEAAEGARPLRMRILNPKS